MKDFTLHNYFEDKATPEEILEISRWLSEDEANQKEYDEAHALYDAIVIQGIESRKKKLGVQSDNKRRYMRIVSAVAASVVFVAGLLTAGFLIEKELLYNELSEKMSIVEVPAGHRLNLTLPDGTEICMNGGSRLEYPLVFDKKVRRVNLSGEAFFDVVHNEEHPFVVETFASKVEVLGTEFNVYADESTETFSTTLLNGKVKVSTNGHEGDNVVIAPDERVDYINKHLVVSKVKARNAISWIDGYINLEGVSFGELMRRFEDVYGVNIIIERTDSINVGYKSGKIKISEGVDFALNILKKAGNFTYEKDLATNTITIK